MTKVEWHKLNYLKGCELMRRNTLVCDRSNPETGYILALRLADLNLDVMHIKNFLLQFWNVGQFDLDELTEFAQWAIDQEGAVPCKTPVR